MQRFTVNCVPVLMVITIHFIHFFYATSSSYTQLFGIIDCQIKSSLLERMRRVPIQRKLRIFKDLVTIVY